MSTFDNRPGFANVKTPTLIISGEYDQLCPPEEGKAMHELIKGSRFELIKDASHSARFEKPEEVLSLVLGFLAAHTH